MKKVSKYTNNMLIIESINKKIHKKYDLKIFHME
jgi:hypothetical protein